MTSGDYCLSLTGGNLSWVDLPALCSHDYLKGMRRKFPDRMLVVTGICALLICALSSQAAYSVTRAVIVGIDDYVDSTIDDLHYCAADAEAFANMLVSRCSVARGDVALLTNEAATLQAIERAIGRLEAVSEARDVVIFYFSGHGAQFPDLDGDEWETDQMDEALVPQGTGSSLAIQH